MSDKMIEFYIKKYTRIFVSIVRSEINRTLVKTTPNVSEKYALCYIGKSHRNLVYDTFWLLKETLWRRWERDNKKKETSEETPNTTGEKETDEKFITQRV